MADNDNLDVLGLFPEAIKNEEFQVFYQPKISLKNYRLEGAEALCRWKHGGEMVAPFRFIPALEAGQEICALDFYMLEHVCQDIKRWLDEGKRVVRVSVNLSRRHFGNENLLKDIIGIIDKYDFPKKYIEIELT
ncbi:MAG: EAL domain-containing protein, partial [Lachnospiraceae bacterium]|nr:EAL domain-containing protein [Lachnospiraceae bacterium]